MGWDSRSLEGGIKPTDLQDTNPPGQRAGYPKGDAPKVPPGTGNPEMPRSPTSADAGSTLRPLSPPAPASASGPTYAEPRNPAVGWPGVPAGQRPVSNTSTRLPPPPASAGPRGVGSDNSLAAPPGPLPADARSTLAEQLGVRPLGPPPRGVSRPRGKR